DGGEPLVLAEPDSPAGKALRAIADALGGRPRGLVGRSLPLTPTRSG
ncbi:MAG: sodium:proton antiporter, partial [Mycobacteriales bacterium]